MGLTIGSCIEILEDKLAIKIDSYFTFVNKNKVYKHLFLVLYVKISELRFIYKGLYVK